MTSCNLRYFVELLRVSFDDKESWPKVRRGIDRTFGGGATRALWKLADQWRSARHSDNLYFGFVVPLAGLLVLRWAAFMEAETEAVAAFNNTDFESNLPEHLREASWGDAHELAFRVKTGLLEVRLQQGSASGRYIGAVVPIVLRCAEWDQEFFDSLVQWVASLTFNSVEGREAAAASFDELLANVVEDQGKLAGEFTTPTQVVELMVELVDPKPGDRVYDPCFGVGGLLVEAARRLRRAAIWNESRGRWEDVRGNGIFGVEINASSFVIGLCRVVLAGIDKPGMEMGDALERSLPRNRAAEGFDCIMAAPPWGAITFPKRELDSIRSREAASTISFSSTLWLTSGPEVVR